MFQPKQELHFKANIKDMYDVANNFNFNVKYPDSLKGSAAIASHLNKEKVFYTSKKTA